MSLRGRLRVPARPDDDRGAEPTDSLATWLDAAPDAMICVEPGGRIAMVNRHASTMFGYDPAELLDQEVELLLPEHLRKHHVQHRREYNRHPQVRSMGTGLSLVARRRDGVEIPVEVSLAPYVTAGPGWVIAAIRDVSEQRALEAASRESEARLRQIAESVDLVFLLLQLDPPAYLYVSSGAQRLIGADSETPVGPGGVAGLRLIHPDDRARVEQGSIEAWAGRAAESEYRLVDDEGRVTWVRAIATPVPNPGGPVERTVITLEDVTERVAVSEALREAEASARSANESKNLFLSRMSHELRTPLNAVLGFGQLLSRQLAGTEHVEAVDYVLRGGRHLLELINDVLDITRIESGAMSLSLEPVALATLVEETLQLMGPLASAGEVTIMPAAGDPDATVLVDRQRFRQILLNLLSNAIKYNDEGGNVWVGWSTDQEVVRLDVRDNGPGIAPQLQRRLFLPFDRLGAEGTNVEGAGIGLALTRSLAELMAGTVEVSSSPGEGATFTVTFPAASHRHTGPAGSGHPPVQPHVAAPHTPSSLATLLYIEDNEPNVHVVEHMLALRPGWRMIHAALGGLGVEFARAHRPDLIFLDLHLPDMPGQEVLRALKRSRDTRHIPVVVLTADASSGLPRELSEVGTERFLTKPFDFDVVLGLLDDLSRDRLRAATPPRGAGGRLAHG